MLRLAALLCVLGPACSFDGGYDHTRFRCDDERGCPADTPCSADGFCEAGAPEIDGGGAVTVPPTFIQEVETTWTTAAGGASKQTPEIEVVAGDVLVALAVAEDGDLGLAGIAGGDLTWTAHEIRDDGQFAWIGLWTAVADTDRALVVQFTATEGGDRAFGGSILTFRGSDGPGASESTDGIGPPTLGITTTAPRSAIVVVNGDWKAEDGARAWRDTVSTLVETSYFQASGTYAAYGGYHADAGDAGARTVGLTAPGDQTYAIAAVEILGHAAP
jgi:hypothetical protein